MNAGSSREATPVRDHSTSFRQFLLGYSSADPRSLGVFRIALGVLLFMDAARRYPDIESHYSNTGWLTNHFMLFRPMSDHLFSLYLTCSLPWQVKVLLGLQLLIDLLLIAGYHTRVMQVLAAVLIASLNSRNVMLENGGSVVLTLLAVWSMFLPLGRRFSVDALLRSLGAEREASLDDLNAPLARDKAPVLSLAVLALVWQWTAIYAFNALQKNGPAWHDGTAVYYALHQYGMLTRLGSWLGDSLSLGASRVLSFGALAMEWLIAALLLVPIKTRITRMLAWLLVCALHLSIASVLNLGTFSWAMIIMFFALVPREAWDMFHARLSARRPSRVLRVDGSNPFALAVCRIIKRFDVLGKVRFEQAEAEDANRFVALDPHSERRARGLKGLRLLAEAFPFGPITVAWLGLPLVSRLAKKWIRRAERKPEFYVGYFELSSPTPTSDGTLSPAKAFFARLWFGLGEALVLVLLVCCGSQLLLENEAVPASLKPTHRPVWMTAVIVYPRLFQGWSMFAPSPPFEDVAVVVDGRTKDGRHFDPLTGREPSFDVAARARHSRNCEWYYFERHLNEDRFKPYLGGVRDFLRSHHEISERPEEQLVAFDVWSVSQPISLPGEPKKPAQKSKVLSYGNVRD
ncbi:MAG TPA: HTTM domain-containing protein [Polyangiaceae bacterium]|nr:HTTM domain-containing protein [Polyangiaceae bacterium]